MRSGDTAPPGRVTRKKGTDTSSEGGNAPVRTSKRRKTSQASKDKSAKGSKRAATTAAAAAPEDHHVEESADEAAAHDACQPEAAIMPGSSRPNKRKAKSQHGRSTQAPRAARAQKDGQPSAQPTPSGVRAVNVVSVLRTDPDFGVSPLDDDSCDEDDEEMPPRHRHKPDDSGFVDDDELPPAEAPGQSVIVIEDDDDVPPQNQPGHLLHATAAHGLEPVPQQSQRSHATAGARTAVAPENVAAAVNAAADKQVHAAAIARGSIGAAHDATETAEASTLDDASRHCDIYADSIYLTMRQSESKFQPGERILGEVTPRMRAILIDWMIEVQVSFSLVHETLYLAVNIVNRCMTLLPISRERLQLIGAVSLLVASKHEELYPPEVADFVYICADTYTRQQILEAECLVLNTLQFELCAPLPLHFLQQHARVVRASRGVQLLAQYLLELTLQEPEFRLTPGSLVSCAALDLANRVINGQTIWCPKLEGLSKYTLQEVENCGRRLNQVALASPPANGQYQMCRKKYATSRYGKISTTPIGFQY